MTALQQLYNQSAPRGVWMNTVPSSVITNTTAETAFDQVYTLQAQSEVTVLPNVVINFRAWGIYSTGLITFGLTLRLRLGSVTGNILAQSSSSGTVASASNAGWNIAGSVLVRGTGSSGTLEYQGSTAFQGSALLPSTTFTPQTGPVAVDTTQDQPFVLTAQWATATANNSIQLRNIVVSQENP